MRHPLLTFHRGDAFTFTPPRPVDWLLCDVIAAPDRSIDLVLEWCRKRLCRHFVVTIKFKGTAEYPVLERLKAELAPLTSDFTLTRLCANKNEVCVMGSTG
jgi:23S rRNA (cytidine2498-2'-O)-methyltransferase